MLLPHSTGLARDTGTEPDAVAATSMTGIYEGRELNPVIVLDATFKVKPAAVSNLSMGVDSVLKLTKPAKSKASLTTAQKRPSRPMVNKGALV